MNPLKDLVLGIIQGITEFLPVSSSAHLDFVPKLLGWGDPGAAFTAVIQLGTTAAVIAYFWKDLLGIVSGFLRSFSGKPNTSKEGPDIAHKDALEARLGWAIIVGTIPACVLGLVLKKFIEKDFRGLQFTGIALIVGAIILMAADYLGKKKRPLESITQMDGWVVGFFQALALLPGMSRSGSTLTGAFVQGLDRKASARFSFLLSIPVILLSGLWEVKDVLKHKTDAEPGQMNLTTADTALTTVISGIVGYICIAFLMKYLQKHSTLVFVIYRIVVGALLLFLISKGSLPGH